MFNLFYINTLLLILTCSSIYGASVNCVTTTKDYDINHKNHNCSYDEQTESIQQWHDKEISANYSYETEAINVNRSTRSIPVLEPVRHLLNHVRDSHLNHTIHHNHENHYHHLLKETIDMNNATMMMNNNNGNVNENENEGSEAIETEMEREMINESNDLRFLEVLGAIGSKLFGFLTNLRHVFAASSAPLLAASSSGSSN